MGRFETEILTGPEHVDALADLSGKWVDRVWERKPIRELILDLDSSVSETYGSQEGTAYNGHVNCTCYHPQTIVQDHPSPHFTTRASGASADMTRTAFARMETA